MSGIIILGAAVCYAAALFFELTAFKSSRTGVVLRNSFTAAGCLMLTVYPAMEHFRLTPSAKFFFAAAWGLAVVESGLSYFRTKISAGVILLPLILLFMGTAWLLTGRSAADSSATYRSLVLIHSHTVLLLAATVGICISFFAAVMYLLQDTRLRRKQLPPESMKLPTLEWSLAVCRWSLTVSLILFFGGAFVGIRLAAVQKTNLPVDFLQDPLLFGTAVLLPVLLLCFIFFPKNNGKVISLSAVLIFLCLLAVLISALFADFAHWKQQNKTVIQNYMPFPRKYLLPFELVPQKCSFVLSA